MGLGNGPSSTNMTLDSLINKGQSGLVVKNGMVNNYPEKGKVIRGSREMLDRISQDYGENFGKDWSFLTPEGYSVQVIEDGTETPAEESAFLEHFTIQVQGTYLDYFFYTVDGSIAVQKDLRTALDAYLKPEEFTYNGPIRFFSEYDDE